MSDEHADRDHRCWNCEGELETIGKGIHCLDCGSRFEQAPNGEVVHSRLLWWVRRYAAAATVVPLLAGLATGVISGDIVPMMVFSVMLLGWYYLEGPVVKEAVEHV